MSVKLRLKRLEDSRKATDEVSHEIRVEQERRARQWIVDMTKSIQQGTPMPRYPESDMPESPGQRKANASAKAWIRQQIERRSEHEQSKKQIS
jgi:uncharacterized protein YfaT (DUF1175 family)